MSDFYDPTYLEDVYAALFLKLAAAKFPDGSGFKFAIRAVEAPDEIASVNQPALVQVQGPLEVEQTEGFSLAKWTFTAVAVVYTRAEGTPASTQKILAQTTANNIVWALMLSLLPAPREVRQTLGGLVYHCWLQGQAFTEVIDQQMVITVPIYILAGTSN